MCFARPSPRSYKKLANAAFTGPVLRHRGKVSQEKPAFSNQRRGISPGHTERTTGPGPERIAYPALPQHLYRCASRPGAGLGVCEVVARGLGARRHDAADRTWPSGRPGPRRRRQSGVRRSRARSPGSAWPCRVFQLSLSGSAMTATLRRGKREISPMGDRARASGRWAVAQRPVSCRAGSTVSAAARRSRAEPPSTGTLCSPDPRTRISPARFQDTERTSGAPQQLTAGNSSAGRRGPVAQPRFRGIAGVIALTRCAGPRRRPRRA